MTNQERASEIVQWLDQCTYIEPHIRTIVKQYILDHIEEAIADYDVLSTSIQDTVEYTDTSTYTDSRHKPSMVAHTVHSRA